MSNHRTLLTGTVILVACANHCVCAEHATTSISPAQGLFIAGEPIDLVMTLHNESDAAVDLKGYPYFRDRLGNGGVVLHITGQASVATADRDVYEKLLTQRGLPQGPAAWWGCCGIALKEQIGPRRTLPVNIYLQQFSRSELGPGDYDVTYVVDIHQEPIRQGETKSPIRGKGQFRITIVKGSDTELSAALVRYAEPGTDIWSRRQRMDGLLLVKSPVVIPYLTRTQWASTEPILAVVRFKGNHEAEEFVLEKLNSGESNDILAALAVLQEWKFILPEREVFRLLHLPNKLSMARIGTIVYAASLPGDIYRSQVRALINDSDTAVAQTAERAYRLSDKTGK